MGLTRRGAPAKTFKTPGAPVRRRGRELHRGSELADAGDLNITAFRGQSGIDADTTIIVLARMGDATLDGTADAFDLNILAAHWQQPAGAHWSGGDFTGDGKVDAFDLNVLAANWQFGAGPLEAALGSPNVPEPGALTILGVGATLLALRRRHLPRRG